MLHSVAEYHFQRKCPVVTDLIKYKVWNALNSKYESLYVDKRINVYFYLWTKQKVTIQYKRRIHSNKYVTCYFQGLL